MKVRVLCILLTLLLSLPFPAAYAASKGATSDVQGHWAEKQLENWIGKGLIQGYGDGSFKPDGTITRAEFMALVNRSFGLTDMAEVTVKDVDSTRWEYEQVAIAKHAGYISGYSDGTMRTGNKVTRQEAAVMLAKLLKLDTSAGADLSKFADAARIPAWSKPSIGAVVAKGIYGGYNNGTIGFDKALTRAETIVMFDRALGVKVAAAYDQAGLYGPATGHETIIGDVLLNASGVSLRNVTIKGDLTFGEGIGEGEAMILDVKVDGDTFIRGGGTHSIYIVESTLGEIEVNKSSGDVRVAIDDQSQIDHIITYSNTTIESTTATQAKAAVAPQIAKQPGVKVLAATQRPIAPTAPPVGSKSAVWNEYFDQIRQYQEDLLAYTLYMSSLPDVTSAGNNTTTSVIGNVLNATNTGNNTQLNVTGSVNTLVISGGNSQLNVGGGVGSLTDSGSNSSIGIKDFAGSVNLLGNSAQLSVGGNSSNIIVSGNNNTITSGGLIGNLSVGGNSSGNQLGFVDTNGIMKLTPLERASLLSAISPSNPPVTVTPIPNATPTPTTPATNTTLSIVQAKAVGAKKIEVKFNKSIDPASIRLSVSKNGSPIAFQAVPDHETKVYTLTLAEKLTEGTYSVTASYTNSSTVIGSKELAVENEKMIYITFANSSDTVAKGTQIGVEVVAKNQYGESMPNLSGFEVSSTVPVEIAAGRPIVVVDTSSQSLQTGISIIPITVRTTDNQLTATKDFRLGTAPLTSKAEFRGSLRGIDGQEVSRADWSRTYHMNFDLYDQYGHMLLYPLSSGVGTVLNPSSASISVGALGRAPAGEPGTFSLPITLNPSGPEEGKDYTFTIFVGSVSASQTFHVVEWSTSPLDLINEASESGTWTGITADTFTAAGVTGVTSSNLAAVIDAIKAEDSTTWTVSELQDMVDAVNNEPNKLAALNAINEAAATKIWADISADTFTTAGVTGVTSSNLEAVKDALDEDNNASWTVAELQAIVDSILSLALINSSMGSGDWTGIAVETFNKAGMNRVTQENLISIMIALEYGYTGARTSTELRGDINAIIDSIQISLEDINKASDSGNWELVTDDQLSMIGVWGVNGDNYMAITDELKKDVGRVWTIVELQVAINHILENLQ